MTTMLLGGVGDEQATLTAPPFTPASIANLRVYLAADVGVYTDAARTTAALVDGDVVGGWADQSGQNNHASQSTTAAKLTLKLAANGINGRAVLLSDGVDDWMATAAFAAALAQPVTIFTLATLPSAGQKMWIDGITAGDRLVQFQENPRAWQMYAGTVVAGTVSDASPHVVVGLYNGASSKLWVDGGTAVLSGNVGANQLTGLMIGAQYNFATPFGGKLGEVEVYAAGLTLAEINQMGPYLATRWGTTWTTAT